MRLTRRSSNMLALSGSPSLTKLEFPISYPITPRQPTPKLVPPESMLSPGNRSDAHSPNFHPRLAKPHRDRCTSARQILLAPTLPWSFSGHLDSKTNHQTKTRIRQAGNMLPGVCHPTSTRGRISRTQPSTGATRETVFCFFDR